MKGGLERRKRDVANEPVAVLVHDLIAAEAKLAGRPLRCDRHSRCGSLDHRYGLDGHQQTLERQHAVLTKLAAAAAG